LIPENEDDADGASSAEQLTEQVPAQQPEQPSQPASEPSLQEVHERHALRIPHQPSQQQQQPLGLPPSSKQSHRQLLHINAESTTQLMASGAQSPVINCCQEDNLVESSCSDDSKPPCWLGVLMPEDPCLLPKPDFTPSQQHPDK